MFGGLADHLVEMVVKASREWPEWVAGKGEGVVRLLGGGLMLPGKAQRVSGSGRRIPRLCRFAVI